MGNCQSLQVNIATNCKFVGRDKDLESCMDLLSTNKSVLVFGMKKIGKSRFIEELYKRLFKQCKSKKYVWKDFELDNIDSDHTLYSWFIEFLTCINARKEKERFENTYPSETIACNSCKNCKQSDRDKCIVRNYLINKATDDLIDALGKYESEIVLFLDNIDKIMDCPELRDCFLHFYYKSVKLAMLQTVLTSANKLKLKTKCYAFLELKPLDNRAILELLFKMTEERENNSEEEKERDGTVKFSPEFQVFTQENGPYIKAIVSLCDGLPLAAAMAGLLLTEDDGLLTPADLVEFLIHIRQQALSSDSCQPDERLDIYTEEMKKVVEDVALFFHCLNEKTTGSYFSIDEAVEASGAAGDNAATGSVVKHKILKTGLDRSILSMQNLRGKQKLKWHGILRECHAALKATYGVDSAKDMILKFMKENAKNAGLDLDEETLCDPTCLALAIRRLTNQMEPSSPVQATEDDEKERMSLLKEYEVASKMVATTKFNTEQSSVLKVTSTAPYHNQNAGNLFEEPPPSYTSTDQINHLPNLAIETSKHFVNSTLPLDSYASFVMSNLRSVSNPSFSSQSIQQNRGADTQLMCSRQANYDNKCLRRARSDPTCYYSENNVSRQPVAKPRREIDTSVGDSLTGQPAMNYIPPSPGIVMQELNKVDAIRSPHEHAHRDRRMQGQSFRSRLSINLSVHKSNAKRSPTAIISPMRRSPPNVKEKNSSPVKPGLLDHSCSSDFELENAALDDDLLQVLLDDEPCLENGRFKDYNPGVAHTTSSTSTRCSDETYMRLVMSSENIVQVFAAVTNCHEKIPILVCLTKTKCTEVPEEFEGFRVLQKPFYPSSQESLKAENSVDISFRGRKYNRFLKKMKNINETIAFHADKLFQNHSNLEAIRLSLVRATRLGFRKRPCIVLVCRCKSYIPFGEYAFPTELRHPKQNFTFKTDVREGYFILCVNGHVITRYANEWNKELAMGCSIGPEKDKYSASIGPFVNIKETNETCLLTVRHLFQPLDKPSDQIVGTNVVQPADGDLSRQVQMPNRRCGTVKAAEMNEKIDAALVTICPERIPSRGNFVDVRRDDLDFAGFTEHQYPVYDDGSTQNATEFTANDFLFDRIIKFGKESGLRKGTLRISNMAIKVVTEIGSIQHGGRSQSRKLSGQLQVDSYARKTFCQEGDSGSAVFHVDRENKLHCIGIVTGIMSDLTCVVTPIQPILEGLGTKINKTLELKSFVHEDMEV
ncbi:uncharacterized protein LOC123551685 [Mercenaria mercenaria]|uniref:uncharacterized protein LOC123551685 n=1 Tax=Mercenaria mercenaria TaxID=6596 RepID=UPI00234EAED6|nr:uncharacterized protein LOC123551685 [Mercenaria mercenaria]